MGVLRLLVFVGKSIPTQKVPQSKEARPTHGVEDQLDNSP